MDNSTLDVSASARQADGYLSKMWNGTSGWQIAITILMILMAYDQYMSLAQFSSNYLYKKGSIAGPRLVVPFIGPFLQRIDPKFEAYEAQWASGKLSCVMVFHKFVVLVSDRDLARKTFTSHNFVKVCLVPMAELLMGKDAWVFLDGRPHTEFRKGLIGLFTRRSLQSYLPLREKVWSDYFDKFVQASKKHGGKPIEHMTAFREINCAISCRTFVGNYISDEAVKKIADDYYCITAALELVNIPLSLSIPYTKVWSGKRATNGVLKEFERCAAEKWICSMIELQKYHDRIAAGETDVEKPAVLVREFNNAEIAQTLFTFLFASQDASSSATIWLFQITAQRPDLLNRLRQENLDVRGGDIDKPLSLELLESMTYTNAVVKEVLRWRPPVIFVPYTCKKDFPITKTYTAPKGAMVIPSCWPALHDPEVYPNPSLFDPERWITGDASDKVKNQRIGKRLIRYLPAFPI